MLKPSPSVIRLMGLQIDAMGAVFEQQLAILARRTAIQALATAPAVAQAMPDTDSGSVKSVTLFNGKLGPVRGQRELLFLIASDPAAGFAYTEYLAFALYGPLDASALGQAWVGLAHRHDALRAQAISDEAVRIGTDAPPWIVIDASNRVDSDEALLADELSRAIDPSQGPLARATLYRCKLDRHVLVLAVHHLVADGWSLGLLLEELSHIYNGIRQARVPRLASARSFLAFVEWTQQLPAAKSGRQSAAPVPRLILPGDGVAQGFEGYRLHRRNPQLPMLGGAAPHSAIFASVRQCAQTLGVSPVMVLLGGFVSFLGRLSGQDRFRIGLPIAGHSLAQLPVMVGMASAVMPLEIDLGGDPSFRQVLQAVNVELGRARAAAVDLFAPEGSNQAPVSVLFNIDPGVQLNFDALRLQPLALPLTHVKVELFFNLLELNGEVLLDFDCNARLASPERVALWLEGLLHLLGHATSEPDTLVSALNLGPLAGAPVQQGLRLIDGLGGMAAIGTPARVWRHEQSLTFTDTGLLAKVAADGSLQMLGSAKRYLRLVEGWVDLDAVEAALCSHPTLLEAASLVEDGAVTAFVVPSESGSVSPEILDRHVRAKLPAHARPRAYVELARLPRDAEGMINHAALQEDASPRQPAQLRVAPRSAMEIQLTALWAEILQLPEQPGVTDDFFALGGHSLKAVTLVNRIARELGKSVPLGAFFRSPTVASLARLLQSALDATPIARLAPAPQHVPSHAQSRLWLLEQLDPELLAYNMGFVIKRARVLPQSVIVSVLGQLAQRHESLRSALVERQGEPWMIVAPVLELAVPVHDLRGRADALAQRELIARQVVGAPFDLGRPPLWRCALLRLDGEDALVVGIHHAIGDNWSIAVWVRDFLALLQHEEDGDAAAAAALPTLDIQYSDYAAWHNARIDADTQALAYWSAKLADPPPVLQLPTCRPRRDLDASSEQRHAGASVVHRLPPRSVATLQRLCAAQGMSTFMVLAATWRLWLWERTGSCDAVIGTLHAGRDHPVLADQIGFFVNTLPLRDQLIPQESFDSLLQRTRQTVLDACDHAETPFNVLVERLQVPRTVSGNPLFEVALTVDDLQDIDALSSRAGCSVHELELPVSQFELTLSGVEDPRGLELRLQYRTALWDEAVIEGWLLEFAALLARACAAPSQALSALVRPADLKVPEAAIGVVANFDLWRHVQPASTAVLGKQIISYDALGCAADNLAQRLVQAGAESDCVVAVLVNRSWHLPAAVLGVMKAAAAVLLLDPTHPTERLAYMLDDARCTLLVVDAEHAALAAQLAQTQAQARDLTLLPVEATVPAPLVVLPTPMASSLAYVVYTSGSTGQPKGVMVEHGALADHLAGMTPVVGVSAGDRSLVFAAAGVDAVIEQLLLPLVNGAAIFVADQQRYVPEELVQSWREWDLNILDLPPVFWGELIALGQRHPDVMRGLALKALLVGGEDMTPARVTGWYALPLYCARLINAYGPTEATITPTAALVAPHAATLARIPIGRPVGQRRARVVLPDGQNASEGEVGELLLGGAALARGYLHQADLSAQKFVTDSDGVRWYRTGDLARRRTDGELEFLGRADRQFKLRGFRIEPDEIEDGLRRCRDVLDAAVTIEHGSDGDYLQAWIVAASSATLSRAVLVEQITRFLPSHMVPTRYKRIEQLPVSRSGKLDREALQGLPAEDLHDAAVGAARIAASATAQALCALLAEVLNVPVVVPQDNFFAIGGHSLKAVQVLARVRERFGAVLTLRDIFASPTVADLAGVIDSTTAHLTVAIPSVSRQGDLLASAGQRRLWLLQTRQPDLVAFNMVAGFHITGSLDVQALACACSALVWRHEVLRTRLVMRAGHLVQDIVPGGDARLVLQREIVNSEAAVEDVIHQELHRPFRLEVESPLRMRLLDSPDGHALVINVHHVAFDGWSANVMLEDLAALYAAALADGAPLAPVDLMQLGGLKPLALQYADYAQWQQTVVPEAQRQYWLSQFDTDELPVLELPTDRNRPAVLSGRGGMVIQPFGELVSRRLHELAARAGVTLFGVMSALTMAQLHALSGSSDLILGTAVAGRESHQLEDQIGFYVNLLPLRGHIDPASSFRVLVQQMGQVAREALLHQDFPFDDLVDVLAPQRLPGRHPLFDVVLILQNLEPMHLKLAGTESRLIQDRSISAKYDLMYMIEGDASLTLHLEYSQDLFDAGTVERLAQEMVALAEAAVHAPDLSLSVLLAPFLPVTAPAASTASTAVVASTQLEDDQW